VTPIAGNDGVAGARGLVVVTRGNDGSIAGGV